jgi:hypothetical protein
MDGFDGGGEDSRRVIKSRRRRIQSVLNNQTLMVIFCKLILATYTYVSV